MALETIFLSHTLSQATQGFGGEAGFAQTPQKSIANGDSSNSSHWTLSNHIGTHVDAPFHFDNKGTTVDLLNAEFWVFKKIYLVTQKSEPNQLIEGVDWREHIPQACDLLLIKTDFERHRNSTDYWQQNPGLAPDLCRWLRSQRPSLRAVGFDFISLTAFGKRAEGREAHQILLNAGDFIIIEDMHLSRLQKAPKSVTVAPVRVENSDGAPATVFAEVEI